MKIMYILAILAVLLLVGCSKPLPVVQLALPVIVVPNETFSVIAPTEVSCIDNNIIVKCDKNSLTVSNYGLVDINGMYYYLIGDNTVYEKTIEKLSPGESITHTLSNIEVSKVVNLNKVIVTPSFGNDSCVNKKKLAILSSC